MTDLSAATMQRLKADGEALYELRLARFGNDEDVGIRARQWASSLLGEAMCVLELTMGNDEAERVMQAMLDSRTSYAGPRTKRMRQ